MGLCYIHNIPWCEVKGKNPRNTSCQPDCGLVSSLTLKKTIYTSMLSSHNNNNNNKKKKYNYCCVKHCPLTVTVFYLLQLLVKAEAVQSSRVLGLSEVSANWKVFCCCCCFCN